MTDYATQLWSQLYLDASLTTHDSNKFLISLSAQSSRNADIRPPKCIPSACLESISMTFHFSTCRRTRNVSSTQVTMSRSGVEHTFASTNPIKQHSDRQHYCPLSLLGGPQGVLDDLPDRCAPWTLSAPSVYTSPVSSQGSISSNTHSTSSFDTPTTSHRYAIQEFELETLVQLLDISLRRMMSDYRPVRPGGVVLSTDSGNPKLAAISPALFSPGYVKVQPVIEFHDTADSLTLGGFAAHRATSHDSTRCVSSVSPHKFQPLETEAQATTRNITRELFGSWLNRGFRPK